MKRPPCICPKPTLVGDEVVLSHDADECLFYGTSPSRMYGVEADVCGIEVVGEEELSTLEIALSWPCNGLIRGRKKWYLLGICRLEPKIRGTENKGGRKGD